MSAPRRAGGGPTPGPWRAYRSQVRWSVMAPDGSVLADIVQGDEANARLIAAAPEMLAALRLVRSAIRVHHETGRNAVIEPGSVVTDTLDEAIRLASGGAL